MSESWIAQRTPGERFLAGAVGGALGGLAFLPVMILLQPTLWAEIVRRVAPALAGTPAEFVGWLLHVSVLTVWGAAFAFVLPRRETAVVVIAALGWAFISAWFTVMAVSLTQVIVVPGLVWALETVAHGLYGLVLGGVLLFLARQRQQEEGAP